MKNVTCKFLHKFAAATLVVLAGILLPLRCEAQVKPQIWFATEDPIHLQKFWHEDDPDYMKLFAPNAAWQQTAKRVSVFELDADYLLRGTTADLSEQVSWLNRHHIAIDVGGPILVGTARSSCGQHTEGFTNDDHFGQNIIRKLKQIGAVPEYWVADEPLFFGYSATPRAGSDPCQLPVPRLAGLASRFTHQLQAAFPGVRFLDIEPISNFPNPDWPAVMGPWLSAYRQASGIPFAGVIMDVAWWAQGWQQRALGITQYLHSARMPVGMIYNGNASEKSNRAWLEEARQHWRQYESLVGGPPDIARFQSWVAQPTKLLPETSPDAFANIVLEYARLH